MAVTHTLDSLLFIQLTDLLFVRQAGLLPLYRSSFGMEANPLSRSASVGM